jgi:RHS repeat-associated protein
VYYHARYDDPALGRFISADRVVPGAGPLTAAPHDAPAQAAGAAGGGGPANPQDLNRYAYGLNNPVRNTDPTGHCVWDACAVEGAALVAIATAAVWVGFQVWNGIDPPDGHQLPPSAAPASDTGGQPADPPLPTPPPNTSDGPGKWETANEAMSDRARAYQQQITGRSGQVYRVNGVKCDGYRHGTLLDAKGPGYANFFENGLPKPWFKASAQTLVAAAQRQIVAARGMPIEWHVAEQEAADAIRALLQNNNVTGVRVVYTPPAP